MDIVERLRESKLIRLTTGGGGEEVELPLHIEAADEIERLRDELKFTDEVRQSALQSLFSAEKEIERLRGLLKNWVDCCFVNFATDTIEIVDVGKVYVETRAALKGEE